MEPKIRRLVMPKVHTIMGLVVLALGIFFLAKVGIWVQKVMKSTGMTPMTVIRLLVNTGAPLQASDGRTNILILGIGGGSHAGADLTDTLMILSINLQRHTMALISIPRDIWSDSLKDKINSAYHYGEEKRKGGGLILAKATIEDVIGLQIHYGVVVDFSGFTKVIDLVNGVTVNVPETFTDPDFPIEGREEDSCDGDRQFRCRYETLHFDAGSHVLNGDRALKYVRSRHAEGAQGSDFARSRRQQDVLVALKQKLSSVSLWLSPDRSVKLFHAFDDATDTDLNLGQIATVGKLLARVNGDGVQKISIEDLLESPPLWQYGRYVLIPKESFEAIHEYIKSQLGRVSK